MSIDGNILLNAGLALAVALIISFALTPVVRTFARRVGAIDVPTEERRVHDHPIPRLGGLAIFLGFILSVVLFADLTRQIQGILLGTILIVIIGAIDDVIPLPAWLKLIVQIIAALVAVAFGVRIEMISNPNIWSSVEYISFGAWSIPITVIWIVGITNSVNLIDGLDGLAVGVSSIASIAMLVIALVLSQWNTAFVLAALVGACIGFMPYNLNPARIFMGDSGALLLGFVMSTVSIVGLLKFYAIISFAVPLLALGLPIFDTLFAIIRRTAHGKNPMMPDRGHFHHRLIDMGFSQKQAVAILYSISAILGLSAVIITTGGEFKAIILVVAFCIAIGIGWALLKMTPRNTTTHSQPEEKKPSDAPEESPSGEEEPAESPAESPSGEEDPAAVPEEGDPPADGEDN